MTLALYGKSRKRQGGLVFSAFMAIMVAALAGVAIVTTAFAHHAEYDANRYCDNGWDATADYVGGDSFKLLVFTDIKVNGVAYDPSWSTGLNTTGTGTNAIVAFDSTPDHPSHANAVFRNGSQAGADYMWADTDNGFDIFTRSGGAGTFVAGGANWTGNVQMYQWADPAGANNDGWYTENAAVNITEPPADTDCGKVIVKKVVTGTGASTSQGFTADIVNEDFDGAAVGEIIDAPFSQDTKYTGVAFDPGSGGDDMNVTEDLVPANWALTGKKVLSGTTEGDCATGTWTTVSGTTAGDRRVDFELNRGEVITVCYRNAYTAPPEGTVTTTKGHSGDGVYNPGEAFTYTLTFTVAGGPVPTGGFFFNDVLPSQLSFVSFGTKSPNTGVWGCSEGSGTVNCHINSGAAAAAYSMPVNVSVKNQNDVCGPLVNNIRTGSVGGQGTISSSDTTQVTGCGSVTYNKTSLGIVSGALRWKVTFTNTSVVQGSITVYDANSSYVSDTCVGGTSESPADTYTCAVPGSGTNGGVAELVVSTALPAGYNAKCDDIKVSNTVAVVGASSDSAEYSDTADGPGKDCITVTKDKTATSNPPTWTITIKNDSDSSQPVWVVDSGAKYQGTTGGGSCTAVVNTTIMTAGIPCTVNANSTLVITVTKAYPVASCEGTDVDNAVSVWVGTYTSTPGTAADKTDSTDNQFENLNADESECTRIVRLCKVWTTENPGDFTTEDFTFSVQDSSDTSDVTITGVEMGNQTPTCILLELAIGTVTINEAVPAGFDTPFHQLDSGPLVLGDIITFELNSVGCSQGETESTAFNEILGLVRSVFSIVFAECTITFYNDTGIVEASGNLQVEKYLDINGDGDANDVGLGEGLIPGWDVTISGDDLNGLFDLPTGSRFFPGQIPGDVYTISEAVVAGYSVTNVTVDGVNKGAVLFTTATIPDGDTVIVRFYNKPNGGLIIAHKVAVTSNNGGPDQVAADDDDGWTITVTSAQCGINQSKPTDANGNASFTNLPQCSDYVVSENPVNASSPGFVPASPTSFNGQTPNGQTLTFLNRKTTTTPPCTDCRQTTPTTTPVTPTTPPTTPATPTTGGSQPPVTQIAGEKTPGVEPTPIAPSTGGGLMGGTAGGMNILLILGGLLALTSGLSFVALGRKNRR